jgi:glycosyltransferase involved in cell wall biosynthesis
MPHIIAILLIRNEDRFLDRVLRNIEGFCDRIIVTDNGSRDRTQEILHHWQQSCPIVECHSIAHPSESHQRIAGFAGTDTWVFGVDGDELYDPHGLARLRNDILAGRYAANWRLVGHTLHCEAFDESTSTATGFMGPPSRTATKLFNFAAIESWQGCAQRLHGGDVKFKQGFSETRHYRTFEHTSWDQSDFRCLHMAFVRRSSLQGQQDTARPNVSESWAGGWRTGLRRITTLISGKTPCSNYKQESYRQGDRTSVDTRPFFTPDRVATPPGGPIQ